jgi:hypothetical protein
MTDRTDALAQTLFNKPALQDCSLQQVEYLAHQYPYFSTAQLLLLQKTPPRSEAYDLNQQRVALHFSNPLQLQAWMQPHFFETTLSQPEVFQNPISPETEIEESVEAPEQLTSKVESETPTSVADAPPDATSQPIAAPTPIAEPKAQVEHPNPETTPEGAVPAETKVLKTEASERTTIEASETPVISPTITFEPYQTVDYFASQGIKLSQQEASNDKLGKQLKSFTEWLKTMKRLPEAQASQPAEGAGEQKVEHLAAHSLDTSDVVTESMAEVWLKQGATEKAADVYNKLRLRNPDKSAYFAAKIESLKKI